MSYYLLSICCPLTYQTGMTVLMHAADAREYATEMVRLLLDDYRMTSETVNAKDEV